MTSRVRKPRTRSAVSPCVEVCVSPVTCTEPRIQKSGVAIESKDIFSGKGIPQQQHTRKKEVRLTSITASRIPLSEELKRTVQAARGTAFAPRACAKLRSAGSLAAREVCGPSPGACGEGVGSGPGARRAVVTLSPSLAPSLLVATRHSHPAAAVQGEG